MKFVHKKPVQVGSVNLQIIRDILYPDIVAVIVLDEIHGLLQIQIFTLGRGIPVFLGETAKNGIQIAQEGIFIFRMGAELTDGVLKGV